MRSSKSVPRTYILADVTAKHPVFHFIFEMIRNFVFQLYGSIRNAAASINDLLETMASVGQASIHFLHVPQ
jgi:hypothetical protein